MAPKTTKRKTAPPKWLFEARRTWGGRLLLELYCLNKTPAWLGGKVGYSIPGSMNQVIHGHHGVSRTVYEKILRWVPEMKGVPYPSPRKKLQGCGAPGPHKEHEYPELGPLESRRAK